MLMLVDLDRLTFVSNESSCSPGRVMGDDGREGTGVRANSSKESDFFLLCLLRVDGGESGGVRGRWSSDILALLHAASPQMSGALEVERLWRIEDRLRRRNRTATQTRAEQ